MRVFLADHHIINDVVPRTIRRQQHEPIRRVDFDGHARSAVISKEAINVPLSGLAAIRSTRMPRPDRRDRLATNAAHYHLIRHPPIGRLPIPRDASPRRGQTTPAPQDRPGFVILTGPENQSTVASIFVPHSGHFPEVLPVRSYPQIRQCGYLCTRNRRDAIHAAIDMSMSNDSG